VNGLRGAVSVMFVISRVESWVLVLIIGFSDNTTDVSNDVGNILAYRVVSSRISRNFILIFPEISAKLKIPSLHYKDLNIRHCLTYYQFYMLQNRSNGYYYRYCCGYWLNNIV